MKKINITEGIHNESAKLYLNYEFELLFFDFLEILKIYVKDNGNSTDLLQNISNNHLLLRHKVLENRLYYLFHEIVWKYNGNIVRSDKGSLMKKAIQLCYCLKQVEKERYRRKIYFCSNLELL